MIKCPKCGADNSIRREGCFNCGTVLQAAPAITVEGPGESPLPATAAGSHPGDAIWYLLAVLAGAWVIWGPIAEVTRSATFAAILIGAGAGTFGQRSLTQAFPDRDTRYLGVILGVATALLAWGILWVTRIGSLLSSA